MLAVRIHQDSGELVQRYLLFMDPGRHRSGARGFSSHVWDPPPPPPPPPPFPPVPSPASFCTTTATAPPLPPPPIGFQHVPPVVSSLTTSSGRFVLGVPPVYVIPSSPTQVTTPPGTGRGRRATSPLNPPMTNGPPQPFDTQGTPITPPPTRPPLSAITDAGVVQTRERSRSRDREPNNALII